MDAETIERRTRKAPPPPRNGVDTLKLFATINVVASQPELAKFPVSCTEPLLDQRNA